MSKRIHEINDIVLRALSTGGKTWAQLVEHTGINRTTIRKTLLSLKGEGSIASIGDGPGAVYVLSMPEAA
jgi:hypothetical protein